MWSRGRGGNRGSRGGGRGRGGSGHWDRRGGNRFRGNFSRGSRGCGGGYRENVFSRLNDNSYNTSDKSFPKRSSDIYVEKLNEIDIGVTEYINTLEGFTGVLKSRYSDFHVNEIAIDGKIAKLTDLKVPVDPEPQNEEDDDDLLVNRYRIEHVPTEIWDRIHKMVQTQNRDELIEIDVTTMTKEDRTKIHEAVKTVFGQKIVGSTISKDDKKFVTFKLFNKNDRIDKREKWPKTRGGEYVYFLVYKEYTDTIEANIQISDSLRMRPSHFCYAGVKDRRAKTTQWFCVRKVDPTRIAERAKYFKNIHVGNFCYKTETLKLGQLKGNRFRVALRCVAAEDDVIDKAMESLKERGFINYYGLQRFGNCKDTPTHEIGIQLLKGNWKEAVHLILKPRKQEMDREVMAAKQVYDETGDATRAYAKLEKKRNRCIEGKLLSGLMKHAENDYVNALENVPRNMRLLYIHAFQSLVWNKMVSKRIKELGFEPVVGDIVVDGEMEDSNQFIETEDMLATATEDETVETETKESSKPQIKVKILTEEDLSKYTIYDIVLPLPGYDITYPENQVKEWYSELLAEYGLSLEMPKQKVKIYTLSGTYRKIVERVTDLSWKTMGYNDPTANLIRSDFEELMGKPEPQSVPNAKFKALIMDFCLSSSCYATMALREVMKMDTSVETHMNFDNKTTKGTQTVISDADALVKETKAVQCDTDNTHTDTKVELKTEIKTENDIKVENNDNEDATDDKMRLDNTDNVDKQTAEKRKIPVEEENGDSKKLKIEDACMNE